MLRPTLGEQIEIDTVLATDVPSAWIDASRLMSALLQVAIAARDAEPVATAMVVVLTYWLSFEYVRDPRRALEPETASAALSRGAFHVLCLLLPYLDEDQREHLHSLAARYATTTGGD